MNKPKKYTWKNVLIWIIEICLALIIVDCVISVVMFFTVDAEIRTEQIFIWIFAILGALKLGMIRYKKTENLSIEPKQSKVSGGVGMLLFGVLLIFLNINRGGGFTNASGQEATGYNMAGFLIWIFSIWLVIGGIRRIIKKRKDEKYFSNKTIKEDLVIPNKKDITLENNKHDDLKLNNSLKIIIVSCFFVMALSVVYYFVISLPKKETKNIEQTEQAEQDKSFKEKKVVQIGEEFLLKNGRKLSINEVTVGNFYVSKLTDTKLMRAQVSVRINSDNGPLNEDEYSKMYIIKGNQLIKLSNSGRANYGQYWFEMPKTSDFDDMKLFFGDEVIVTLTPYIRVNSL